MTYYVFSGTLNPTHFTSRKPLDMNKLYDITSSDTTLLDFLFSYFLTTMKNYFLCARILQQQLLHQQRTLTSLPKSQHLMIVKMRTVT